MRNYQRKTTRGQLPKENFDAAILSVKNGMSIRNAAVSHDINYRTLARYVRKWEEKGTLEQVSIDYKQVRLCLNEEMERDLASYIKKAAAIFYGITIDELRILAFKLAIANKLEKLPLSWM